MFVLSCIIEINRSLRQVSDFDVAGGGRVAQAVERLGAGGHRETEHTLALGS